ncbi:thioesterase family protein [Metabacillus litoralis]|uniref:acyl-CoA thioesterase n=1 Tax=Metabacillus litoralis TaxID=152268 RepID=UPI00203DDB7D|nr:thioesterase family protein [Metabacillus litoralis]MCM3160628.1 acyl-CoA thioesterase [Metabacillus litoralis]
MKNNYDFKVRWGDTDAAGIVFYPNFYKWMDEATHEYLSAIGYPSSKLIQEQQIGCPILEANCQFKQPLLFEDSVRVQSTVQEIQNKVFKISHVFLRGEKEIAKGYEVRAWTSFKEKPKAQPIPEEVRAKMLQPDQTVEV